jgi:hypothetical protein
LAHGLQVTTIDSFLTIVFKVGLESYFRIATTGMKRSTLQQHKEVAMLCEKNMTTTKARSALSVSQNIKQTIITKKQSNTWKINKHCINCGMKNHNVETCKKKKEQTMMVTTEATQLSQKTQKTFSYACHICGLNGHKMTNCPKFVEMQKMFHGKSVIVAKVQLVSETQTIIMDVNVMDVNVTTRSKVIEEHVFMDKEPRKTKSVAN